MMSDQQSSICKHALELEQRTAPLYVQSTGRQQCLPGWSWGPGIRDHFLLFHVVSGRGTYQCGDKIYELCAGDAFLIFPNTTIRYEADADDPWAYVWVGFNGPEALACLERTDLSLEAPVLFGRGGGELQALAEEIDSCCGPAPWEELGMTARLYEIFSLLARTGGSSRQQKETDCARLAADYIVTHYEQPITVEGLAAYTSVSHSSLYRQFVKRFQIAPKRFLLEYRIERACRLLAEGRCSIQEISNSVGFEDPFYFSRAFKEVKGVSPRQYAALVREKDGERL